MSADKPAWLRSRQLARDLGEPDELVLEIVDGAPRATTVWHDGPTQNILVVHDDAGEDVYDLGDAPTGATLPLPAVPPAVLRTRVAAARAKPKRPQQGRQP